MSKHSPTNPYPGLRSFEPDEDYLFFGRERQIHETLERLLRTRFLGVIGSSGSGKSSLLRAGLIPALFKGKGQQMPSGNKGWKLVLFRPGDQPVHAFAYALMQAFPLSSGEDNRAFMMEKDPMAVADYLKSVIEHQNILIVVDQFEEIFRFRQGSHADAAGISHHFIDLLLNSIEISGVYVAITMRADFLGDCAEFERLTQALNSGQYLVPRMTTDEQAASIVKPAEVCGASITPRLVEKLIQDTGMSNDHLPVMQHAMMRTWTHWMQNRIEPGQPIDIQDYEAVGTMKEALSRHAEEIFAEIPDNRGREITEKIFKALTNLGSDNRGTRRPTRLDEICALAEAREDQVIAILERFRAESRGFLMPQPSVPLLSETVVDITHESLMRVWNRLRTWVEEETKSAEIYLALSRSATMFQAGRGSLLVDPQLQLTMKWRSDTKPNVVWAMRYDPAFERAIQFLEQSYNSYSQDVANRENRQKKELRRARIFSIVLGTASVISLLVLIVALNLKFEADASAKKALEQKIIAERAGYEAARQSKEALSQKRISEQQQQIAELQQQIAEREKQFAVEQQQIATEQRNKAIAQEKIANQERVKAEEQRRVAENARIEADRRREEARKQKEIAEEQRQKAEISEGKALGLRALSLGRSLAVQAALMARTNNKDRLPALLALQAYNLNSSNKGDLNDPDIFSALSKTAGEDIVYRGHNDGIRAVAISSGGEAMISVGDDGTARFWSLKQNGSPAAIPLRMIPPATIKLPRTGGEVLRAVAIAEDGRNVIAGRLDGSVLLWNIRNQERSEPVMLNTGFVRTSQNAAPPAVYTVAINSKDDFAAAGLADGTVKVWNMENPQSPARDLLKTGAKVNSLAFSRDGRQLAAGTEDGMLYIVSIANATKREIKVSAASVRAVTFSRDGEYMAAGCADGRIRVWSMKNLEARPRELSGHTAAITSLSFSPRGDALASASTDRTARIWNFTRPDSPPIVLEGHDSWVWSIAYAPDGTSLITGSADKTLRQWVVRPELLASAICRKMQGAALTQEEWNRYVDPNLPYQQQCR
jgi:WD40 repeat protein